MPRRKRTILTALSFVLLTSVLGAGMATLVTRSILLSTATTHLQAYASDLLAEDEKVATNINDTLDAADASPYPACSDEDFTLLRSLAFHSPYIKDVGRKQDDHFVCSVMAGKVTHPTLSTGQSVKPKGYHGVVYNVPIEIDHNFHGEVVGSPRSNVVLPPNIFDEFHRPPLFFSAAVIDTARHSMVTTYSNAPFAPTVDSLLVTRAVQHDGYLLYAQRSPNRPDYVLTGIALTDLWSTNRAILLGAIFAGALIGIAFSGTTLFMDRQRRTLASQLRRAIHCKDLTVVYQPIAEVATSRIVGAEALVRWTDEDGDRVSPELFIALAESHHFVSTITTFVLQTVIDDLGDLLRADPGFHVSVNVSAQDVTDPTFIPRLDRLLRVHRIPASSIGLELTERCTADREHVIDIIHQLRARGHVVYIDDFGTGYSSLAYLNELAVDIIKVDRSFTQTIGTHSVTVSILPQILAMASALKLTVIVEGVEHAEQAAYLAQFDGEIHAQGWFFGEPNTPGTLKSLLMQARESPAAPVVTETVVPETVVNGKVVLNETVVLK